MSILLVFLALGILFTGCTQNQSGNQAQSGVNAVQPVKTTLQSSTVTPSITQVAPIAETTTPISYNILVTATRKDPSTITVTYQGGPSAQYLQQLVVLADRANIGSIDPPVGLVFLPEGSSQTFSAPASSHIEIYGHFINGVQKVLDNTL